jgi:tetratricopeptide (TPR) repeat protein
MTDRLLLSLRPGWRRLVAVLALLLVAAGAAQGATEPAQAFAEANKLFYAGKYRAAAAAYAQLLTNGASATLWFNLGNAYFKADQRGHAIAAYREALRLEPRDPAARFNLKFVREKVAGSEPAAGSVWQRALTALTLNEWTLLTVVAWWLLFLLLALRELRPALRKALRLYVGLAGLASAVFAGGLAAAHAQTQTAMAVIVVPEAVVRNGPLDVSPVVFQLRDGVEVGVLNQQVITDQGKQQTWLQVQDAARRVGWIKRDQTVGLRG